MNINLRYSACSTVMNTNIAVCRLQHIWRDCNCRRVWLVHNYCTDLMSLFIHAFEHNTNSHFSMQMYIIVKSLLIEIYFIYMGKYASFLSLLQNYCFNIYIIHELNNENEQKTVLLLLTYEYIFTSNNYVRE